MSSDNSSSAAAAISEIFEKLSLAVLQLTEYEIKCQSPTKSKATQLTKFPTQKVPDALKHVIICQAVLQRTSFEKADRAPTKQHDLKVEEAGLWRNLDLFLFSRSR